MTEEEDLKAIYEITRMINVQVVIDTVVKLLKDDKQYGPLTKGEASFIMFQDLGF